MATHNIYFNLPKTEISNVDANLHIFKDGAKLGQLTISKGGLDYYPKNSKKPITIDWTRFDEIMREKK